MKEADFQQWIVEVAHRFGWHVWHVPAPMRMGRGGKWIGAKEGAGLPDLILLHDDPPRLLFLEVKSDKGLLRPEQQDFLRRARIVAAEAVRFPDMKIDIGTVPAIESLIAAHAVWPKDADAVEHMLRSKVVT